MRHSFGVLRERNFWRDRFSVAALLRPYKIKSKSVWIGGGVTVKGYHRDQFVDAWARWLGAEDTRATDPAQEGSGSSGASGPSAHGAGELTDLTDLTDKVQGSACAPSSNGNGRPHPETLAALTHEQRLDHWRAVRERDRQAVEDGAPTLAALTNEELFAAAGPGTTREHERTDVEQAAEIIAACLAGAAHVIGQWWPSKPIRNGLARGGITDEDTIGAALKLLGVEVRKFGAGASWRLVDYVPRDRERTNGRRANR